MSGYPCDACNYFNELLYKVSGATPKKKGSRTVLFPEPVGPITLDDKSILGVAYIRLARNIPNNHVVRRQIIHFHLSTAPCEGEFLAISYH